MEVVRGVSQTLLEPLASRKAKEAHSESWRRPREDLSHPTPPAPPPLCWAGAAVCWCCRPPRALAEAGGPNQVSNG